MSSLIGVLGFRGFLEGGAFPLFLNHVKSILEVILHVQYFFYFSIFVLVCLQEF